MIQTCLFDTNGLQREKNADQRLPSWFESEQETANFNPILLLPFSQQRHTPRKHLAEQTIVVLTSAIANGIGGYPYGVHARFTTSFPYDLGTGQWVKRGNNSPVNLKGGDRKRVTLMAPPFADTAGSRHTQPLALLLACLLARLRWLRAAPPRGQSSRPARQRRRRNRFSCSSCSAMVPSATARCGLHRPLFFIVAK